MSPQFIVSQWFVLCFPSPIPHLVHNGPFRVPRGWCGPAFVWAPRRRGTRATATNCEGDHLAPVAAPSGALHRGRGTLAPVGWGGKADEMVFLRPARHWKRGRSRAVEGTAAHSFSRRRNARSEALRRSANGVGFLRRGAARALRPRSERQVHPGPEPDVVVDSIGDEERELGDKVA